MYSPRDDEDPPEFLKGPFSVTDSDLSIMSFQVERFLQEAQKNTPTSNSNSQLQDLDSQTAAARQQQQQQPIEWIWDWTAQPEYFSGQEWKACESKHERGDFMSLLLMTNIVSIVIGAGITAALMRRSNT